MRIYLTLHTILRDYLPHKASGKTTLTLPCGTDVAYIIEHLNIKQSVSAAVDGREVETDHVLQEGDHLHMFCMIAGG